MTLNSLLQEAGSPQLDPELAAKFETYLALLQKWNAKTNLTAIRDAESILRRHFLESILCARSLPANIATLLDFGSGAGFPGIPIALINIDLKVTLAESQHKKAAFLREAVRSLNLTTSVHSGRAEDLRQTFDCITLRAVDHMEKAIPAALPLLAPGGYLALLTTIEDQPRLQSFANLKWLPTQPIGHRTQAILLLGQSIQ
jgi:16S rRNA (guanine527-N7)-methyltransferase